VSAPKPQPMRAVIYGASGRYELHVVDLADLVRQAISKGLVVVEEKRR
jgi:hypothetical protein